MAIITIGKGKDYSCPYYAAPFVQNGDIVEIFPGTYGGAWFWSPNITIEGMGPGVIIQSDDLTQGKGLFVLSGKNVTVKNITFQNATNSDGNGAGINFTGTNLTVLDSTFINDQDGILTAPNRASTVTVKNSTFIGNGSDAGAHGAAHGIYVGAAATLDVENSTFSNTQQGHSIKSRANNTIVINNKITDGPTGTSSYLIDIPNGGAATITGNYLEKGPNSSNSTYAITVGEEGVKNPAGPVVIANNTFVNDDTAGVIFAHNQTGNSDFTVTGNKLSGQSTVLLTGQGKAVDPNAPAPAQLPHRPDGRDFNGDGKDDILAMSVWGSRVEIAVMNGMNPQVTATLAGPAPSGWSALFTGDYDGDGKSDILWQNNDTQAIDIYTMDGTSKTGSAMLVPGAGWRAVGNGDFNADGKADLVLQKGSQVEIWLMNGAAVAGSSVLSTAAPAGYHVVATGDFNGDGKADILWQNSSTGALQVWMMNGSSLASTASLDNPGPGWRAVDTGDFAGDGHTDILFQNKWTGQCAVWLMNGTTRAGGGNLSSNLGLDWKAVGSGDFNGDGKSDVLFRNPGNGAYAEWMVSGTSILSGSGITSFNPTTDFYAVAGR